MGKKGGRGGHAPAGGMRPAGGGSGMMKQIQELQAEMARTQEALGDETVEVTAGGGAVKVVMTGHQKLQTVAIDPELLNPDDVEMLQDMIVAAVNEAVDRSQALAAERMGRLTGGLSIPGLF
jgi:DNA-binding YbaB/EbfC family protein